MRAVIQRVSEASVTIDGRRVAEIGAGLLVLLGVAVGDTDEDAHWLASRIAGLRIMADEAGLMNLSVASTHGAVIVVSQFTLHASYKKGNRPSFLQAARPEVAAPLYERLVANLREVLGPDKVQTGVFGADMSVALVNDGPVTIVMDTANKE